MKKTFTTIIALAIGACSSQTSTKENTIPLKVKLAQEFEIPHKTSGFYDIKESGYYLITTDSKDKVHLIINTDRKRSDSFKYSKKDVFISTITSKDEYNPLNNVPKTMVLYLEKGDEVSGWLERAGDLDPLPGAIAKVSLGKLSQVNISGQTVPVEVKNVRLALQLATQLPAYKELASVKTEKECKSNYNFDKVFATFVTPRTKEAEAQIKASKILEACMNKFNK